MSIRITASFTEILLVFLSVHGIFIYVPVALILFIFGYFGIYKKQPICSCKDILEAHKNIIARLPLNKKTEIMNPFSNSSWIVRTSLLIFAGYCIIGFLASVAFLFIFDSIFVGSDSKIILPIIGSISKETLRLSIFLQFIYFCVLLIALKEITVGGRMCMTENENMDKALIAMSD